jgi:hypothetical protein
MQIFGFEALISLDFQSFSGCTEAKTLWFNNSGAPPAPIFAPDRGLELGSKR